MQASHKVIFNTGVTYFRAFITVFVSLYSTKLIVKALGIEDFGLYSLVGGLVAMLAFFKSALTASTQRFISVNIGKGLLDQVKIVIANSIVIHFLVGLFIVILIEIFGAYMLQHNLVIPNDRMYAVKLVFQFVVLSTFVTIISVPFEAILNAHENMLFLAVLGVIEVLLKFIVAIFLTYVEEVDKLVFYSLLLFLILLSINLIKYFYCLYKYKETKVSIIKDFSVEQVKVHTGFIGWNLFGAACSMGRGHGIAIISNTFFGPLVNAAYGVANQVKSQSSFFSLTVIRVLNPQIMKSEGANDRDRMLRLSLMSCKFGYFFLAFFVIPLIFEMPTVIKLWLGTTPPYVVVFCQLILIGALVEQLTIGLISAVQSVGNIKIYQMSVGGLILLNLPVTYFLLKNGYEAEVAFYVYITIEIFAGTLRLILCRNIVKLPVKYYLNKVIYKVFFPTVISVLISLFIVTFFDMKFRFILTFILSILTFFIVSIFYLEKNEYELCKLLINKFLVAARFKR